MANIYLVKEGVCSFLVVRVITVFGSVYNSNRQEAYWGTL